jgi:hypothetical protein
VYPRERPVDGLRVGVADHPVGDCRQRLLGGFVGPVVERNEDLVGDAAEECEHRCDPAARAARHDVHRELHRRGAQSLRETSAAAAEMADAATSRC